MPVQQGRGMPPSGHDQCIRRSQRLWAGRAWADKYPRYRKCVRRGRSDPPSPYVELGVTGLKRWSGYVEEEFLPALRGRKAVQIFKEMAENDAIVGALLFSVDMLVRAVQWHVQPASSDPMDQQAADFVQSCMEDMSHTWDELITEVLSMLVYGWSWHEVIYKKRQGTNRNQEFNSNHDDGLIGWGNMPIPTQQTW